MRVYRFVGEGGKGVGGRGQGVKEGDKIQELFSDFKATFSFLSKT